jgi:hypothetical protein
MDSLQVRKSDESLEGERAMKVKVKVIKRNLGRMVVEWVEDGKLKRGELPQSDLIGEDQVEDRKLEWAIPYGEPWEEVTLQASSEMLAEEFRRVGIWTVKDLEQNPEKARAALMAAYGLDFHSLLKLIRERR